MKNVTFNKHIYIYYYKLQKPKPKTKISFCKYL